jgi:hypothetical protein
MWKEGFNTWIRRLQHTNVFRSVFRDCIPLCGLEGAFRSAAPAGAEASASLILEASLVTNSSSKSEISQKSMSSSVLSESGESRLIDTGSIVSFRYIKLACSLYQKSYQLPLILTFQQFSRSNSMLEIPVYCQPLGERAYKFEK